jgi:hypothetical protein
MQHAGKVLTHRHYLRVHMAALRRKIEPTPAPRAGS